MDQADVCDVKLVVFFPAATALHFDGNAVAFNPFGQVPALADLRDGVFRIPAIVGHMGNRLIWKY
jgi:hypothetical protein